MGQLRVAVRLAAREARQRRVRTIAIVLTLALPITVASAVDIVARSSHLTVAEQLHRDLGDGEALVTRAPFARVYQAPNPSDGTGPALGFAPSTPQAQTVGPLPAGSLPRAAVVIPEIDTSAFLVSSHNGNAYEIRGVDIRAHSVAALVVLDSGRAPAAADELTISHHVANQLGVGVGAVLTIPGSPIRLTVVGIAHSRYSPSDDVAYALPGTAQQIQQLTASGAFAQQSGFFQWYISSPSPVTWPEVEKLNAQGFVVTSRSVVLRPPPRSDVPFYTSAIGNQDADFSNSNRGRNREIAAVLAGMVLLEIILLAGPAFMVGARKRQYELALVSASGGEPRHIAGMVLADGALLGALAAVAGSALGIGAGAVILALIPQHSGRIPGQVTLMPGELIGIAALAVVSGLLAALVPALLAARQPTVALLTSRRQPTRLSWRPATAGVACLAAALVIIVIDEITASSGPLILVLAAALGEVGCALVAPALLALIGRVGIRLPLWPRLALRDASRNRSAAAPAVAAIIAVVAATAALLIWGATDVTHDRLTYQPYLLIGDGAAFLSAQQATVAPQAALELRAALPGSDVLVVQGAGDGPCPTAGAAVGTATDSCRQVVVLPAPAPGCPEPVINFGPGGFGGGYIQGEIGKAGVQCTGPLVNPGNLTTIMVDDGSTITRILGGANGRAAATALRSGKAVVLDPSAFYHGTVALTFSSGQPARVTLPAVQVNSPVPLATMVIPPTEAVRLNLVVSNTTVYVKNARSQPASHLRAANVDLVRLGVDGLSIERGFHSHLGLGLLAAAVGDLVLTFGAALAATALMAVDGRDELLTMAAVGAAPAGRRRLAMARAGVICLVGAGFGVLAGVIPGIALVSRVRQLNSHIGLFDNLLGPGYGRYPLTIPWLDLAILVVGAPLLATITAAVVTRARLPSERRRAW